MTPFLPSPQDHFLRSDPPEQATQMDPTELQPSLSSTKNRVSLNWTQINAVVEGISAIDLPSLAIRTRADALSFAREYGFDIDNPDAIEEIERVHGEAIAFIEENLLDGAQKSTISQEVRHPEHVVDLLVYSSKYLNKSNLRQMWACAVLKVMHAIFHIDHDAKLMYFDDIRQQIFESLDRVIVANGKQFFLTDGELNLPLVEVEKKRNKGRRSILLKLLQKPSYVASDIYDHLGVRLVFETKTECLFALKLLRRTHILSATNIKPSRSRNNLVDLEISKKTFNRFRNLLARSDQYPIESLRKMDQDMDARFVKKARENNPHSSDKFSTIQVTTRKMVQITSPLHHRLVDFLSKIKEPGNVPEELLRELKNQKSHSFYFDYEIQLMDRKSYENSLYGPASHEAYKRRQIESARSRVLGPRLIQLLQEQRQSNEQPAHV